MARVIGEIGDKDILEVFRRSDLLIAKIEKEYEKIKEEESYE